LPDRPHLREERRRPPARVAVRDEGERLRLGARCRLNLPQVSQQRPNQPAREVR
jgi:hypothetical protein